MAKTILITGASSGLGAGMAREFAAKGYNLALCARRLERLETLQQELQKPVFRSGQDQDPGCDSLR